MRSFTKQHVQTILVQYSAILYLLSPAIMLYTIITAIKYRQLRYLRERFGLYSTRLEPGRIWFHASSVGEVNAVAPLIRAIAGRNPELKFLLTTGTPTGAQLAAQVLPERTVHTYLPIDFPGAAKRFIRYSQPRCAIIMETELWANLYRECDIHSIPISIINARLSDRTLKANAWMYRLYTETLSHVRKILARSEADANGFMTIGATASKIKVIGNIKFAHVDVSDVNGLEELKRPYVLAASTHSNEEYELARLWLERFPERLLVIAPRHPNRLDKILKQLSRLEAKLSIRSRGEVIEADTNIYLADTVGEMGHLIKGAEAIIMGGSFVPRGGHNVIEPARFGKLIIFGQYMDNFISEANLLLSNDACIQVKSYQACMDTLARSYAEPEMKSRYETNSVKTIERYGDILDKYIAAIEEPYENYKANTIL